MFNSQNLGALVVKEDPHVQNWEDARYGIQEMFIEESYGFGIINEGQRPFRPLPYLLRRKTAAKPWGSARAGHFATFAKFDRKVSLETTKRILISNFRLAPPGTNRAHEGSECRAGCSEPHCAAIAMEKRELEGWG